MAALQPDHRRALAARRTSALIDGALSGARSRRTSRSCEDVRALWSQGSLSSGARADGVLEERHLAVRRAAICDRRGVEYQPGPDASLQQFPRSALEIGCVSVSKQVGVPGYRVPAYERPEHELELRVLAETGCCGAPLRMELVDDAGRAANDDFVSFSCS
jgi:hypothetical protein